MEPPTNPVLVGDRQADPLWARLTRTAQPSTPVPWRRQTLGNCDVEDASLVVVTAASDRETARALADIRERAREEVRIVALFRDEATARLSRDAPRVRTIGVRRLVAQHTVRTSPPLLQGAVAAPPMVIGDGPLAMEIVRAIVTGWGYPGDPVAIHCLGSHAEWAQEAAAEAGHRAQLSWAEVPPTPALVIDAVRRLSAQHQPPPPNRGEPAGPTITVVLGDPELTLVLAGAVAAAVPDARVVAVVDELIGSAPRGVTVAAEPDVVATAIVTESPRASVLEEVLLEDLAWVGLETTPATAPPVPLFDSPVRVGSDPLSLDRQPQALQDQLATVVAALPDIMAAGAVELGGDDVWDQEPLVLTPGELSAMADRLLKALTLDAVDGARLGALELAFRLPRLAARAGLVARRRPGYVPVLPFEEIERLAPLVHHAYQQAARETNNATGSPYAYAHWRALSDFERSANRAMIVGSAVGWAMEGLDWSPTDTPKQIELNEAQLERLAELEHRRWAHHQRANGRPRHEWIKPWQELEPPERHYDDLIVRALPRLLSLAGIELAPFA